MTSDLMKFAVDEPFPVRGVEKFEGAKLEIMGEHGWLVGIVGFPGMKESERQGLKAGFKRIGFYETIEDGVPLAFLMFHLHGNLFQETCFNAKVVRPEYLEAFMAPDEEGRVKNALSFFALDWDSHGQAILKVMRTVGLDDRLLLAFHETIRKQLATNYDPFQFHQAHMKVDRLTMKQIFERAIVQRFKPQSPWPPRPE